MTATVSCSLIALGCVLIWLLTVVIWIPVHTHRLVLRLSKAFSRAIELRSVNHYGLGKELDTLSVRIARELRLGKRSIYRLRVAGNLRDIGLSAIPYSVLNSQEQLTDAQSAVYSRHPDIGASMLDMIPALQTYAGIVRGQSRSSLSVEDPYQNLESNILTVVSDFLLKEREFGLERALEKIEELQGEKYDPRVVQGLRHVIMK